MRFVALFALSLACASPVSSHHFARPSERPQLHDPREIPLGRCGEPAPITREDGEKFYIVQCTSGVIIITPAILLEGMKINDQEDRTWQR